VDSQAIQEDIKDLAGVRIALYFPGDQQDIESIIKDAFTILTTQPFPDRAQQPKYPKQFDGYHAMHYLVRLKSDKNGSAVQRYLDARIEIQVASVLMHAWAEVEHDLVYKPLSGQLSDAEYDILDELNGLTLTGEIALRRLQAAINARVNSDATAFTNHYELAAFLYRELHLAQHDGAEFPIGRIDLLFQLLRASEKNDTAAVRPLLEAVNTKPEHDRAIADQLIDLFIGTNKQRYQTYEQLRLSTSDTAEPYLQGLDERDKVMGAFLSAWIQLERAIRQRIGKPNVPVHPWRVAELDIPAGEVEELASLRRTRNQIVHGIEIPPLDYLRTATQRILAAVKMLRPKPPRKGRRNE
jgi:hypothetical protein